MMATNIEEDSRTALVKLECVKEIRNKMVHVERLRNRLASEIEAVQVEEASLAEYRAEVDQLLQEKMAHVEELRQIHADINSMENIIKNGEDARMKALDTARRLYEEYQPLKNETSRLVAIHLPRTHSLPSLTLEDDPVPPNFFEKAGIEWPHESEECVGSGMSVHSNALSGLSSTLAGIPNIGLPAPFLTHHQGGALGQMRSPQKLDQRPLPPPPGPPAPAFRQQPPPMKSCLSCHQQIHRNAPICPLCKAKSRSRNPKKPKKKD
uniref:Zinc finger C4H2 domain-containing protein-like n=2 Tax=Hirondellea gigas TaxID=1518452 RepID=A0A6A7FRE6_9CRUS